MTQEGRCLIYDATPPPSPPENVGFIFYLPRRFPPRGRIVGQAASLSNPFFPIYAFFFSFFKTLQFREIYTLSNVGKDSRTIFLHFSSRRLQLIEIQVM